jgi:hypothetical protein
MEVKKNPNAKRQFCPLRCVMHPLYRPLKRCAFLQTIAPLFFICVHSGLLVAVDFSRLRRAVIQRRASPKAQGAAKKGCGKVLQSSFYLGPVRAYCVLRTEIPCLRPKRYAQLRSQWPSQFCLTKYAPHIPVLCFVYELAAALNQSNISTPPPGHEGARKGGPGMC